VSEDQLLTAKEVAHACGIHTNTIHYWRRTGKITPAGHEGRAALYRLADVRVVVEAMRIVFPHRREWAGE
jgi:DNA-binding transcriptional MerR regulator